MINEVKTEGDKVAPTSHVLSETMGNVSCDITDVLVFENECSDINFYSRKIG